MLQHYFSSEPTVPAVACRLKLTVFELANDRQFVTWLPAVGQACNLLIRVGPGGVQKRILTPAITAAVLDGETKSHRVADTAR